MRLFFLFVVVIALQSCQVSSSYNNSELFSLATQYEKELDSEKKSVISDKIWNHLTFKFPIILNNCSKSLIMQINESLLKGKKSLNIPSMRDLNWETAFKFKNFIYIKRLTGKKENIEMTKDSRDKTKVVNWVEMENHSNYLLYKTKDEIKILKVSYSKNQ